MKILVHYPLYHICNLVCKYCFFYERMIKGIQNGPNFTVEQYNQFRSTHLSLVDEIVLHFHSGEPFIGKNLELVKEVINKTTIERFDFLSNGLGDYSTLMKCKDRIRRVGFTFHRLMVKDKPELIEQFNNNVVFLKEAGIPVYVKELLLPSVKDQILKAKLSWENQGVTFRIQDFKGFQHYETGHDNTESKEYSFDDWLLVDDEYINFGETCACNWGYKNVIIRGDHEPGNILACWFDKKVVGNILTNTYNPNYEVKSVNGQMTVEVNHG